MPLAGDIYPPDTVSHFHPIDGSSFQQHYVESQRRKHSRQTSEDPSENVICNSRSRTVFGGRSTNSATHRPRRLSSVRASSISNSGRQRENQLPAGSQPLADRELSAAMQTYHRTTQSQQQYAAAVDFELQQASANQTQTFAPFAVLAHQCIPVCCAPTMTTAAHHVPVNGWAFPAPCSTTGMQLIPCCDGNGLCTGHHGTAAGPAATRHFYGRPTAMGMNPYHHHCTTQFHATATHRLPPPPSMAGVPMPMGSSIYQTPHMQPTSHVMSSAQQPQPAMYQQPPPQHQQQARQSATVYHGHQMSVTQQQQLPQQHVYHQPQLIQRSTGHQLSDEMLTDANLANISYLSSQQLYQQQQQQQQQQHVQQQQHHAAAAAAAAAAASVAGQPLLLQPVPGEFITGTFPHYRPVTTSRQRYRTYPPMATATPYSGYLLHFLAMLGRPTAVVSATLPHHRASMQHDDFAELDSYEALLNLAERLGDVKSRGLTRPDIERLRCYRYESSAAAVASESDSALEQTSCVVCLCDFEPRELVRSLPCQHEFHARCVDKWLKLNRTCPLCRADVTEPVKMDVE